VHPDVLDPELGAFALGWLAVVPKSDLALLEHGLMMPAMLVPMVLRLELYTGRAGHSRHHGQAER
jgi:hypothetical protein